MQLYQPDRELVCEVVCELVCAWRGRLEERRVRLKAIVLLSKGFRTFMIFLRKKMPDLRPDPAIAVPERKIA
jgi:hypothetical protein